MNERITFEREIFGLDPGKYLGDLSSSILKLWQCRDLAAFNTVQDGIRQGDIAGEELKGKPITVTVRCYEGTTSSVALVFAGVHGDEDEGLLTTLEIRKKLDAAYAATPKKRAKFHTFLIENLRAKRDTIDPASKNERWVERIEPNRNFPLAGEGLAAAERRKGMGIELVDPDTRRFTNLSPRQPEDFTDKRGVKRASKFIIPENRILLKLIACIKPSRVMSIHSHDVKNRRGDGPGVFVDPRGGFDTDLDAPLTAEGRDDDILADRMLKAAIKGLAASKLSKLEQTEALQGNQPGSGNFFGETVHYSFGASKARGTSFGMWAPAPIRGQGDEDRSGMQTITLELPKWLKYRKKKQTEELGDLWAGIVIEHFLGLK